MIKVSNPTQTAPANGLKPKERARRSAARARTRGKSLWRRRWLKAGGLFRRPGAKLKLELSLTGLREHRRRSLVLSVAELT